MNFRITILLLSLLIIYSCSFKGLEKADLSEPKIEDYISVYNTGILGHLPVACKVSEIQFDGDSVFVLGRAFDKMTEETFSNNVWIGKYKEIINSGSSKYYKLKKDKKLLVTDVDGIFRLKFKLKKNDLIIIGIIGYNPAIIKIYDYVKDFY